jgi:hypothetical protein
MFTITLIFFSIFFTIIIHYIRKFNEKPKGFESIPFTSSLYTVWALLRQKPHDEIQDAIQKSSEGHDVYLV